ncbi:Glutamate-cysteine ligase family 2(GCS2) [Amycolatopsis marina]|uniref:Glutamate-cysteine ligase family 2(GCS2) n=1 Tax=Amycolatopsis marina TaxID=490629 RepID=A0A1I1C2X4_9PSEU|nr:Glutamate-cysteine ligase family 2(GCS2) [Amycolatopsis marina]
MANSDLAYVTDLLALSGLRLGTCDMNPFRPPARLLSTSEYAAMERRFAPMGPSGVTMMCSIAALQVCVDIAPRHPSRTIANLGCAALKAVDLSAATIADITYSVQRRTHGERAATTSRR